MTPLDLEEMLARAEGALRGGDDSYELHAFRHLTHPDHVARLIRMLQRRTAALTDAVENGHQSWCEMANYYRINPTCSCGLDLQKAALAYTGEPE